MVGGDESFDLLHTFGGGRVAAEVAAEGGKGEVRGLVDRIGAGGSGCVFHLFEFGEELQDALRRIACFDGERGAVAIGFELLVLAVARHEECNWQG